MWYVADTNDCLPKSSFLLILLPDSPKFSWSPSSSKCRHFSSLHAHRCGMWLRAGLWQTHTRHLTGSESHSVVSDFLRPQGLYTPWNSPGQNTGVSSLSLLQGIFPTQGSNPGLLHCKRILYQLSHKGSPSYRKKESMLSRVQLFATPWTVAYQAPLSMGFSFFLFFFLIQNFYYPQKKPHTHQLSVPIFPSPPGWGDN